MRILIILSLLSINLLSESIYKFQNEEDELRFNTLIKDIRCPKCSSGSLLSSNAPISEDLKNKIVEMINSDYSDQEIKNYVSERFGKESLYEPELAKDTLFLWFAPFALLILSLLIFVFRRT